MPAPSALDGINALLFDVFGTVVDWRTSIINVLRAAAPPTLVVDWGIFADVWRAGYIRTTLQISQGAEGPTTVDEIHRQLLDGLLESPRWSHLAPLWDDDARSHLVLAWHRLHGWEDVSPALYALKSKCIIGTLSNGNIRLLVDMAIHADLPWDVVFSSELFSSYKPNPVVYDGARRYLSLPADQIALVAAHIRDCAGAKACGFKTVYVRRPTEDKNVQVDETQADIVVNDFTELARLMGATTS